MKEKIQNKIEDVVNYIVSKPVEEVTLDDYTILANELKNIRNQEAQSDNSKRMAELLSTMAYAPANHVV